MFHIEKIEKMGTDLFLKKRPALKEKNLPKNKSVPVYW
jgi:hypothetical protein